MTEERIRDIIVENDVHLTDVIIKAMKQAVNEAIQECADVARIDPEEEGMWTPAILNLKVK